MRPESPRGRRILHGRRRGKRLRPSQAELLATRLPEISIDIPDAGAPLDVGQFAGDGGRPGPLWLEIGFGSGEHLVHQARLHPDCLLLGCEPYINGVAAALSKIERDRIGNVRIHPGDVRDLMDALPTAVVERTFLPYPDPWPKKRHHGRRFFTPEYLLPLARIMKPGAELRLATDIPGYARQAIERIAAGSEFGWTPRSRADWIAPWDDWFPTRYERKARARGAMSLYLTFVRR